MRSKLKMIFLTVFFSVSAFSFSETQKGELHNYFDLQVDSIDLNIDITPTYSAVDPVAIDITSEITDSLTNDDSLKEYIVQINRTGKLQVSIKTQSTSVWGWNFSIKKENGNTLKSVFCTQVFDDCNTDPKSFEITIGQASLGAYIITVETRNSFSTPTSPYTLTLSFQNIDANEIDTDGDGVTDPSDAFPLDNSENADSDLDGIGDNADVFPNNPSESGDNDNDGVGDNADLDDDNDSVEDINDEMPFDETEILDTDGDGIGNNSDTDDDGDGLIDEKDPYALDSTRPFYSALISNRTAQAGSWINGVARSGSQFQLTITNRSSYEIALLDFTVLDGNQTLISSVSDDSLLGEDGVLSPTESTSLTVTLNANRQGPISLAYRYVNPNQGDDSFENSTAVFNGSAVSVSRSYALDTDLDGQDNDSDTDDDNDGLNDEYDALPLDASEQIDTDGDGIGNNADTDDDDDGVDDSTDVFPLDVTESVDTDSDGVGDNADVFPNDASETLDSDSDGTGDNSDAFPNISAYNSDSDSDGMPNKWEVRYGLDPNDASDATSDQDNDGVAALDEFLAGTIPAGSLDIDGNGQFDALTDGLLLLRGMFLLSGDSLISDAVASDAVYKTSDEVASRIDMLGDLVDIDGNGSVDALTDGLVILRYLFNLRGDVLINDVIASDATVKTAEDVEAKIELLIPAL